jgi:hypothetical protein
VARVDFTTDVTVKGKLEKRLEGYQSIKEERIKSIIV